MGRQSDSQSTSIREYFLPEWVVGILYNGEWFEIEEGSLKEKIQTPRGTMTIYIDPFSKEVVFLKEEIMGFRIKQQEFRPVLVVEGE